jgi:hypothetical protein
VTLTLFLEEKCRIPNESDFTGAPEKNKYFNRRQRFSPLNRAIKRPVTGFCHRPFNLGN